jgi:hypothetical protein
MENNAGLNVSKGPLIDYLYVVKEEFYRDKMNIVREGKHGKWIWTICEGSVRVSVKTPKGDVIVARLGEGCFIGTIKALLFGEYERSATVTAEGDVRLCLLDAEPLYHEYSSLSGDLKMTLLSLDRRLRMINDLVLREHSGEDHRGKDHGARHKRLEVKDEMFLIKDGTADVIAPRNGGGLRLLSLNRHDVLGNIPFMHFGHEPGDAYITVSQDFNAVRLDRNGLMEEYNKLSCTFRNMIYNMGTNLCMTTRLVNGYCI